MKQSKTIVEWTLEITKDAFDAFLSIIKLVMGGSSSGGDSNSDYWEKERQRERNGYYKDR